MPSTRPTRQSPRQQAATPAEDPRDPACSRPDRALASRTPRAIRARAIQSVSRACRNRLRGGALALVSCSRSRGWARYWSLRRGSSPARSKRRSLGKPGRPMHLEPPRERLVAWPSKDAPMPSPQPRARPQINPMASVAILFSLLVWAALAAGRHRAALRQRPARNPGGAELRAAVRPRACPRSRRAQAARPRRPARLRRDGPRRPHRRRRGN
jgi:hypothetical protein